MERFLEKFYPSASPTLGVWDLAEDEFVEVVVVVVIAEAVFELQPEAEIR